MMTSSLDFLKKRSKNLNHIMPLYSSLENKPKVELIETYAPTFTLEDFDYIDIY